MRIIGGIASVAVVLVAATACSSGGEPASGAAPSSVASSPAPSSAAPTGANTALPACTVDDISVTGAAGSRPQITVPDSCSPPTGLLSKDLVVGTGPAVVLGSDVVVQYEAVKWSDKLVLDSSWQRGSGGFTLQDAGRAAVIEGWNEGLIGMQQGGRRLLIIPPDKAYGDGGRGIRPNETLVFVVDAVSVS